MVQKQEETDAAINNNNLYICSETLAESLLLVDGELTDGEKIELSDDLSLMIKVDKIS